MIKNTKIKDNNQHLDESILNIIKSKNLNPITIKEILEIINKNTDNQITKSQITRILTKLKNDWKIEKTNINVKYIIDSKRKDPLYGKAIPKQYIKYFSSLLDDVKKDEELWQILKDKLESLVNSSDINQKTKEELILKIKELKNDEKLNSNIINILIIIWDQVHLLFKLYDVIIEEVAKRWLYNNHKKYWILTRQNTANQYRLPE